jgi:hypothetical protein
VKKVLEVETSLGTCNPEVLSRHEVEIAGEGPYILHVQSTAFLNGSRHMLRIEHSCMVKSDEDLADQPWVKPELVLEPLLSSEVELSGIVQQSHEAFLQKTRDQLPSECLLPSIPT